MFSFLFPAHKKNVEFKQKQREERIAELTEYAKPLTASEENIVATDAPTLHDLLVKGEYSKEAVVKAFSKKALLVNKDTNALTEIMIKDTPKWAKEADVSKPLGGIPVSLKDAFPIEGYDASIGISEFINVPSEDSPVVKVLKDAGAIPYVKTNIPKTMFTIESYNDVWGVTHNAHKKGFSAGGSSTGEGALIGAGGSRIGVGSDIAGSVRAPAAFNGHFSLRMTCHRFPSAGHVATSHGFDGVPPTASPMAQTLPDLKFFISGLFKMKPWLYDFSLYPFPWDEEASLPAKPKIGVLRTNDYLEPTPAVSRALDETAAVLKKQGYDVVDFKLPRPGIDYAEAINKLFLADGFHELCKPLFYGELNDTGVYKLWFYAKLPKCVRYVVEWFYYYVLGKKDFALAMRWAWPTDVAGWWDRVDKRDGYRYEFREAWLKSGIDFLISPPAPCPAPPIPFSDSIFALEYTSLWNFLDYPSGIVPVSRVSEKDVVTSDTSQLNWISKRIFSIYDPVKMAGLPLAVQITAPQFKDELAIKGMELVQSALEAEGVEYK